MQTRIMVARLGVLIACVLFMTGTVSAQDVAAAARANRAKKEAANGPAQSEWYNPTHASLQMQGPDASVTFQYEFSANGETRITAETTEKGKREVGEMMVVNGRTQWMLARNIPLEKGYEIDALDSPVLSLKLALEFLRAAVPSGPSSIEEKTRLEVKENERSITVHTASAGGKIEAPWVLSGTIQPLTANQWSFDLSVQAAQAMQMSGTWRREDTSPVFDDDMPLNDWQILSIGPIKTTVGTSTILDYGAQVSSKRAKTLGELRKM